MDRRTFLKIFGTTTTAGIICPNELMAMTKEEKKIIASFLGHEINVTPRHKHKDTKIILPKGFQPVPVTSAKDTIALIEQANFHIMQTNSFQKNKDIKRFAQKYYTNINERKLNLHNAHTGENYNEVFWVNGKYDLDALKRLDYLLRDFRRNETIEIKLGVIEGLYRMQHFSDKRLPLIINSGYRSKATNDMLRKRSKNVAKYSMHIKGAAIDFTVDYKSKIKLSSLYKIANKYHHGGVGYYPKSHFIHIDAGPNRRWNIG